jgi:hypothetical protein
MPRIGPRGLEFARARVEMKAIETVLLLRRAHPRRLRSMVPGHVWSLVRSYRLMPSQEELAGSVADDWTATTQSADEGTTLAQSASEGTTPAQSGSGRALTIRSAGPGAPPAMDGRSPPGDREALGGGTGIGIERAPGPRNGA